MAAKPERQRRKRRRSRWDHLIGLGGLGCVVWAVVGLIRSGEVSDPVDPAGEPHQAPAALARAEQSYYPLQVGRYWVYRREDPHRGVVTEIERRIERRESRPGQDLFFFADGTMAFCELDRVLEVGVNGGVNVIPLGAASSREPYVYRSQGLHIEKAIETVDTVMVFNGRRYEDCIGVVTRFRPLDQGMEEVRSYMSYYARGIGLVGREEWPRKTTATSSMALHAYGVNHL